MKAYQKAKQFVKDHDDAFCTAVTVGTAAALTGVALLIAGYAAKEQKQLNAWVQEQNFAGKTVYPLADGTYLAVSQEQIS